MRPTLPESPRTLENAEHGPADRILAEVGLVKRRRDDGGLEYSERPHTAE
jgi:hypothetical protein